MRRNEDELTGKGKQAAGGIKDKVGEWTRDSNLEAEGEAQHDEGKVQEKFGEGRRKVGEAVQDAGRKIGK